MEKQQTHPNKTGHQSHEQPPPKLPIKGQNSKSIESPPPNPGFPNTWSPSSALKDFACQMMWREMFELKVYNKMEPGALKWLQQIDRNFLERTWIQGCDYKIHL